MDVTLVIDPEFQNKIPPLTDQEFSQLEENILEAGRVYEPIVIWNGTIVDGHNRYKIVKKHPEIIWETREMDFPDKWAAFDWMYKNQLGRRNLTDEQRTYLLGKLYEARKKTVGKHTGNQYTKMERRQNDAIPTGRVREQIMQEQHVGQKTVERAETFAKGIDDIRQTDSALADEILTAKKKVKKIDVMALAKAEPEKKKEMIDKIKSGKPLAEMKPEDQVITAIVENMRSDDEIVFTADNLVGQITVNADSFIRTLSNILMEHADICNDNRMIVIKTIDDKITKRIEQIKERLNDGKQL